MLFHEASFWAFFAVVLGAYLVLPHRLQNRMLLVASYVFYAAWDWRFLSLILLSTVVDYIVGGRMRRAVDQRSRWRLLLASLGVNLGLLAVFKYFGFFADSFADLMGLFGYQPGWVTMSIVLPVGISFYTFQTLSYTIDIYRKELEPTEDFFDFALFVAFFPQLVAGPIERARNLLPNITAPRRLTWDQAQRGAVLCLLGLFKKIVIADQIAPAVDQVYANPDASGGMVLVATWLFAIQIYCDFSGYTDIARGVSKILGFRLMLNFRQPYFASNPQEFWRRWHISLSTWLRDYLYISLGGNRQGPARTNVNLMTTMALGGFWHGAAWNFILWGIYQGALLIGHRATQLITPFPPRPTALAKVIRVVKVALFFQLVCYGWLLFRAGSFSQIAEYTIRLGDITMAQIASAPTPPEFALVGVLFLFLWDLGAEFFGGQTFYLRLPGIIRAAIWAAMCYLIALSATGQSQSFIYFQF